MSENLSKTINSVAEIPVSNERKSILQPLIDYIQNKANNLKEVRINFICTHNSRRSHLSQVWAQTMAFHFNIQNVFCYSGGTEATALYPEIVAVLGYQGFQIQDLSQGNNPVHAIKFSANEPAVIGFSKTFDNNFNPQSEFLAVMTCSHADEGCPFIAGAEKRVPVRYDDPKQFDGSELQFQKYLETSITIATEMYYVFSKINSYVSH
jgi:arsenate reductase